jgi:hypothetical protein
LLHGLFVCLQDPHHFRNQSAAAGNDVAEGNQMNEISLKSETSPSTSCSQAGPATSELHEGGTCSGRSGGSCQYEQQQPAVHHGFLFQQNSESTTGGLSPSVDQYNNQQQQLALAASRESPDQDDEYQILQFEGESGSRETPVKYQFLAQQGHMQQQSSPRRSFSAAAGTSPPTAACGGRAAAGIAACVQQQEAANANIMGLSIASAAPSLSKQEWDFFHSRGCFFDARKQDATDHANAAAAAAVIPNSSSRALYSHEQFSAGTYCKNMHHRFTDSMINEVDLPIILSDFLYFHFCTDCMHDQHMNFVRGVQLLIMDMPRQLLLMWS